MSDTGQPIWVQALLDHDLTAAEYRVLAYFGWREGTNGHSWPSQRRIAADLGLTVQGVRNIVRRLERKGWLIISRPEGAGRGHVTRYKLTSPGEKVNGHLPLDSEKGSTGVEDSQEKGQPPKREKVNTGSAEGSTGVDPNTIQRTHPEEHNQELASPGEPNGIDLGSLREQVDIKTRVLKSALERHLPNRTQLSKDTHQRMIDHMVGRAACGIPESLQHLTDAIEWIHESKAPEISNPPAIWTTLCQKRAGCPKKKPKGERRKPGTIGDAMEGLLAEKVGG